MQVSWFDERAEVFPARLPKGVRAVATHRLLDEIAAAPPGASYLVLTHSHALDFMLCETVLRRGDFVYLGLIGSRTKRRRFERGFRELGLAPDVIARLTCPIGGSALRDKRPAVIAALTAAELLIVHGAPKAPQDARKRAAPNLARSGA
jgi:xanthine dehydrogenase accessory factor